MSDTFFNVQVLFGDEQFAANMHSINPELNIRYGCSADAELAKFRIEPDATINVGDMIAYDASDWHVVAVVDCDARNLVLVAQKEMM
jgi:hypothetical protein